MPLDSSDSSKTPLSEAKKRLLQQRLNRKSRIAKPKEPLKRPQSSISLASAGQKRIWLMEQLNPGSPAYNLTSSFEFEGTLNSDKIGRAFNTIRSRHESLRSVFKWKNSQLLVEVQNSDNLDIHIEKTSDIERCALQHSQTIFDLTQGPLIKLVVIYGADGIGRILLVIHHIAFDEWSQSIFWKEFETLYNENGKLCDFEYDFLDFAHWQNSKINAGEFNPQLEYWKNQLSGAPPQIDLPSINGHENTQSDSGKIESRTLSAQTSSVIKSLAKEFNVSPFVPILVAFGILLYKYSDSEDIVIGIPIANRPKKEFSNTLGFFLNTVALRLRLKNDPTIQDIITNASRTVLEAISNQDIPFDSVIESIKPERFNGIAPIVQTMFVYQKETQSDHPIKFGSQALHPILSKTNAAKLDLTLFATEAENEIKLSLEYRKKAFEEDIILGMLRHLNNIIHAFKKSPHTRLSEITILDSSEKNDLIQHSTGPQIPLKGIALIPEQIRKYTTVTPDAIAITSDGQTINYLELERRVESLSRSLIGRSYGNGKRIALYMERSIDSIIAILAILRSGSHYIPIDPSYPNNRTELILSDSQPCAIFADHIFHEKLASLLPIPLISIDYESTDSNSLRSEITGTDTAYIIYTSGSTGKPKGVSISHENLRQSTFSRRCYYSEKPKSFLLLSSLSFDSSVAGIFWTLSTGGMLVLPKPGEEKQPDQIRRIVQSQKISTLLCIPGLYREILADDSHKLKSLRTAIVAGEDCPTQLVKLHSDHLPNCSLNNEYGPTEATVWSTASSLKNNQAVTIGTPIANYQTFVFNDRLQMQPIGIPGELCIAGPGLAQGYVNNPKLTEHKFCTTNLIDDKPIQIYRTGDKAVHLPNGDIKLLGRIDNQVKIRGFRLEIGEVENALLNLNDIHEVAVLSIQENNPSSIETQLVAFLGTSSVPHPSATEYRNKLAEKLPRHAIPSQFVFLKELPKLPNGKINRNALKVPNKKNRTQQSDERNPTKTELKLLEIWEELFSSQTIQTSDNFFDLGGSSLQAIRLFSSIKKTFDKSISASKLLQSPTIVELAQIIDNKDKYSKLKNLICLQEGTDLSPIILVHAAGQELIFYRNLVNRIDDRIPIYGIQPIGHDGSESPTEDFEKIIDRYTDEILATQESGSYRIIGHCQGGVFAMEIARRLKAKRKSISLVISIDGEAPKIKLDHSNQTSKQPHSLFSNTRRIARGIRWRTNRLIANIQYRFFLKFGNDEKKTKAIYKESFLAVTNSINKRWTSPFNFEVIVLRCRDSEVYPRHSDVEWRQAAPNANFIKFDCLHDEILEEPHVKQTAACIMQKYFSQD